MNRKIVECPICDKPMEYAMKSAVLRGTWYWCRICRRFHFKKREDFTPGGR